MKHIKEQHLYEIYIYFLLLSNVCLLNKSTISFKKSFNDPKTTCNNVIGYQKHCVVFPPVLFDIFDIYYKIDL